MHELTNAVIRKSVSFISIRTSANWSSSSIFTILIVWARVWTATWRFFIKIIYILKWEHLSGFEWYFSRCLKLAIWWINSNKSYSVGVVYNTPWTQHCIRRLALPAEYIDRRFFSFVYRVHSNYSNPFYLLKKSVNNKQKHVLLWHSSLNWY